jgi:hypothetical protein
MAGNREKFDNSKLSGISFFSKSANTDTSIEDEDKRMEDELVASFNASVSIRDTMCAVLTDANSNFDDLCSQLNSMDISIHRNNTLKQANIVADHVEIDLNRITSLHGPAQTVAEEEHRFLISQVVQAYIRCLELDTEKWKHRLKEAGKSDSEIAEVKIVINEFSPWETRKHTAPAYNEDKLEKPAGNHVADQISFVQGALNYWRSAYLYIREYERLVGAKKYDIEKKLWHLEQTTISYLNATAEGLNRVDINLHRLREPRSINPLTGEPVSVKEIRELIQKQQEQSGYQLQ